MWTFRTLAPAGGFPSVPNLLAELRELTRSGRNQPSKATLAANSLRQRLEQIYLHKKITLVGSGTEALLRAFQQLSQSCNRVLLGGYTCPDVVTAARGAGLTVVPIDIDPRTLELNAEDLRSQVVDASTVVLFSNLYGLVDRTGFELLRATEAKIVDDACQAAMSIDGDVRCGARGHYGVISAGRGKAFCGIGGGAVISDLQLEDATIERAVDLGGWVRAALFSILERPELYYFPASMPFLALGETKYHLNVYRKNLTVPLLLSFLYQLKSPPTPDLWSDLLRNLRIVCPKVERNGQESVSMIRYPVIFESSEQRDTALRKLSAAGLGASGSYPSSIVTLCGADVAKRELPLAESVSKRILTLPTHRYVTAKDRELTVRIIEELVGYR